MAQDLIKVLAEVRGTGEPEAPYTDGIYHDIAIKDYNSNSGMYGDIVVKHGEVESDHADVMGVADAIFEGGGMADQVEQVDTQFHAIAGEDGTGNTDGFYKETVDNVTSTAADVVITNADAASTTQDSIDTNADKVSTAADRVQTGLDTGTVTTKADEASVSAAAALVSEGIADTRATESAESEELARIAQFASEDAKDEANEWANNPEDVLVMDIPGQYSALHYAAKAVADLGYMASTVDGVVTHSTGDDATIPAATQSEAGLMVATDKLRFDTINSEVAVLTNKDITDPSNHVHANRVEYRVKAAAAEIPKGAPVTINEFFVDGAEPEGGVAEGVITDQSITTQYGVANGIAADTIAVGEIGVVVISGRIRGLNTESYTENQMLFVNGGTLTATEPTSGWAQPVAKVLRDHATDGVIQVQAQAPKQDAYNVRYDGTTNTSLVATDNDTEVQVAIEHLDVELNTHKTSTGADHTYIDQDVTVTGTPTFGAVTVTNDVWIKGNAVIDGELTTITATEIAVDDKNITLANTDTPTDVTADGGGITVKGTTDKTILWLDATDAWTLNQHLDVAGNVVVSGTVDGRDVSADGAKLDLIEASATADQTGTEIKVAYELEVDTNAYTDSEKVTNNKIDNTAVQSIVFNADGTITITTA